MSNETSSRVWFITGACTGFGRELAKHLAAEAAGEAAYAGGEPVSK